MLVLRPKMLDPGLETPSLIIEKPTFDRERLVFRLERVVRSLDIPNFGLGVLAFDFGLGEAR